MGELSSRGATIVQIVDSVNYVPMPAGGSGTVLPTTAFALRLARADEDLAGNLTRLLPGGHGVAGLLGEDHLQGARLVLDRAAVLAREAQREHPCAFIRLARRKQYLVHAVGNRPALSDRQSLQQLAQVHESRDGHETSSAAGARRSRSRAFTPLRDMAPDVGRGIARRCRGESRDVLAGEGLEPHVCAGEDGTGRVQAMRPRSNGPAEPAGPLDFSAPRALHGRRGGVRRQPAALSGSSPTTLASSVSGSPPPTSMKLRRSAPSILRRREAWAAKPVPAGMRRPTITFSLSPRRSALRPRTAASVSTRVVSWNEAAEMNDSVASDALVMPSSTGCSRAAFLPSCCARSLMSSARERSSCSPRSSAVSPASCTSVLRSIWRMITSMCLSLIFTPCRR